jgi:hypothetical protein
MNFQRPKPYIIRQDNPKGHILACIFEPLTTSEDIGKPVVFVDKETVAFSTDPNQYDAIIATDEGYKVNGGATLITVYLRDPLGFHMLMSKFDTEGSK